MQSHFLWKLNPLFSPLKVQNEIIVRVQVVGLNQFQSFWVSVNVILWDFKVKDSIANIAFSLFSNIWVIGNVADAFILTKSIHESDI